MSTEPKKISAVRVALGLYVAGAIVSYGPIAVTMRDEAEPGPNLAERRGYGVVLAAILTPAWPLYWSYQIAARPRA